MRRAPLLLSFISLIALAPASRAGLVAPGETISINSSDFALPGGSLLAEKTTPFTIDYGGVDPIKGSLYSAVYDVGGNLAFLYDVDFDPANSIDAATERSDLRVTAFAGLITNVSGMLEHEEVIQASRSADGSEVTLFSDTPGLGGAPALLIQTDATNYDDLGSAVFYAGDELLTMNANRANAASVTVQGAFQPVLGDNGPPPTAIPLPPAAYSGLGVLLAMGLIVAVRRRVAV